MKIKNIIKSIFSYFGIFLFRADKIKIKNFLNRIYIYDTGYNLIKIGEGDQDGSYLIPNALKDIKYCFSPGVGETVNFENDLKKNNIKSFLADGTLFKNKIKKIDYDFINKNINTYYDEKNIKLEQWINLKLKKKEQKNLLLQMDIEGNEYSIILDASRDVLKKFKILIIEFHDFYNLGSPAGLQLYTDVFMKLLQDFYICHIHPNNCCGYVNLNKISIPQVMEFTFINKKNVRKLNKITYKLPHRLDIKNSKNNPNLELPERFYK
jgi:hypothetical protein